MFQTGRWLTDRALQSAYREGALPATYWLTRIATHQRSIQAVNNQTQGAEAGVRWVALDYN